MLHMLQQFSLRTNDSQRLPAIPCNMDATRKTARREPGGHSLILISGRLPAGRSLSLEQRAVEDVVLLSAIMQRPSMTGPASDRLRKIAEHYRQKAAECRTKADLTDDEWARRSFLNLLNFGCGSGCKRHDECKDQKNSSMPVQGRTTRRGKKMSSENWGVMQKAPPLRAGLRFPCSTNHPHSSGCAVPAQLHYSGHAPRARTGRLSPRDRRSYLILAPLRRRASASHEQSLARDTPWRAIRAPSDKLRCAILARPVDCGSASQAQRRFSPFWPCSESTMNPNIPMFGARNRRVRTAY